MNNFQIVLQPTNSELYTEQIQNAIDKCASYGGGEIIIKPGIYKSKPIKLISNLQIYFECGSILQFSDNFSDYQPVFTRWEGTECFALQSMIFAENCKNIKLSGYGLIDGLGEKWWQSYRDLKDNNFLDQVIQVQQILKPLNKDITFGSGGGGIETNFLRPSLLQLKNCTDTLLNDLTLKDSAFWNTHILYCKNLKLSNLNFINPPDAPNTDGLDIDSSSFIDIEGCNFNVGDDCLCIKSGMDEDGYRVGKSCNNINITHCNMNRGHGGIVLGSETAGGIHDIHIKNCKMSDTDRGIRIKTRRGRGGTIKNITLENLIMVNIICPIVINMYYKCGAISNDIPYLSSLNKEKFSMLTTPVIENITITNIQAFNIKSTAGYFFGLTESPIKNLTINNFIVTSDKKSDILSPAMDFFETLPQSHDFLIKNVKNQNLKNIYMDGKEC